MKKRKGGARLAPRKSPGFLTVFIPILLIAALAVGAFFLFIKPDKTNDEQNVPELTPAPSVSPSDEPEPSPEVSPLPSPEVSDEPSPEVTPEATPEATPEVTPEVTPEPTPEVSPEPTPEVTPEPSPETTPEPSPEQSPDPSEEPVPSPSAEPVMPEKPNGEIYSTCALLTDLDTGEVMFASDADEINYPASLTKILSATVVLESGIDLSSTVTFTDEMLAGLYEAGAAVVGYSAGDEVTVLDLLYGLMLPSGADCANALAVTVGGSIDEFVAMMNEKAAAVGMLSSHFTNPVGLHHADQYSTARDMTVLLRHALANPDFFTIYTTASRKNAPTASLPDGVWVTNYILGGGLDISFEGGSILGAKTGFTTPAGQCLSSYTVINGRRFILITMGAGREFDFDDKYSLNDALHLYTLLSTGTLPR